MVCLMPLEKALNAALSVDLESQQKLHAFEARTIHLKLTDLQLDIHVTVQQTKLYLTPHSKSPADLSIVASSFSLLKVAQAPENLFSSEIKILGDVQFAKQLQDWLDGFDFDWEAQLARITGDTLAYPLAQGLRQTFFWLQKSKNSFETSLAEYLREESRLLPAQVEINRFMSEIDRLRADTDRIEARIHRLLLRQQGTTA